MARRVALVLTDGPADERTLTALRLAERLLARGNRVSLFAHAGAATLSVDGTEVGRAVGALIRRGVHGATLDWVVDGAAAEALGAGQAQAAGVVSGDHADLWAFVRDADLVLSVGGVE